MAFFSLKENLCEWLEQVPQVECPCLAKSSCAQVQIRDRKLVRQAVKLVEVSEYSHVAVAEELRGQVAGGGLADLPMLDGESRYIWLSNNPWQVIT